MSTNTSAPPETTRPIDDLRLFGPPPLMPGDDPKGYEALRAAICADMAPRDALDLMWTRDIIDLQWELMRLRHLKVEAVKAGIRRELDYREVLSCPDDEEDPHGYALWRAARDRGIAARAAAQAAHFFPFDIEYDWNEHPALATRELVSHLDLIGKIERLIASAETRRNTAYKHAEQRRNNLGARLRKAVDVAEATLAPQVDSAAAATPTPPADAFAAVTLVPQADNAAKGPDAVTATEATPAPQADDATAAFKEAA